MIKDFLKIHSYNYKQSDKNFFNFKIFKIEDHHKKILTCIRILFFLNKKKKLEKLKIYLFYHQEYLRRLI